MARLGVLGWPVSHSRSPAMHNAALAAAGLAGWRYQRLPVPPGLFEQTVRALGGSGFAGANVTIPHKQAALALADSASETARAIGAANTLTFAADGTISADNTDAGGLIAALGQPPRGRRALVLGAGGSARAAVWALRQAGAAEVSVWNRTPGRAQALARELGVHALARPQPADLLVNCTSVGLARASGAAGAASPAGAPSPAGAASADTTEGVAEELAQLGLTGELVGACGCVVDLVYGVRETALVALARQRGVPAVDGLEVLVAQGALSFSLWTGKQAPLAVMRDAARGVPEVARGGPGPRPAATETP